MKPIKTQIEELENVYLWSNLSITKRFLLLPIFFLIWQIDFLKHYWLNDVHLVFYKEVLEE